MLNYIWSIRFINTSSCHLLSCEFKLWRHRFVHCSNAHDNQSVNCAVSFFFGHKSWVGPQAGICQGVLNSLWWGGGGSQSRLRGRRRRTWNRKWGDSTKVVWSLRFFSSFIHNLAQWNPSKQNTLQPKNHSLPILRTFFILLTFQKLINNNLQREFAGVIGNIVQFHNSWWSDSRQHGRSCWEDGRCY